MATNPVTITYKLIQSDSNTIQTLQDITGSYSTGNPNAWNANSNDNVSNVTSVYVSGTYFSPNTPPMTIASTELMPSPNALPYVLEQKFTLSPTLFNLGTQFNDGLYVYAVIVNSSAGYQYSSTATKLITTNTDGLMAQALSLKDPFCTDCSFDLFDVFIELMQAKEDALCNQNNSALNKLFRVQQCLSQYTY